MGMMELFLIAVGLSMDAFAVAVCKGLALRKVNLGQMALVGLWFGGFQALMPLAGYFVGAAGHHRREYDSRVPFQRGGMS